MSADVEDLVAPAEGPVAGGPVPAPTALERGWRRLRRSGFLLALPALLLLFLLFLLPLLRIAWQSLNEHPTDIGTTERYFGIGNYTTLFTDGYTLRILLRTLAISAVIALVTGVFAYPYAYMMTIVSVRTRAVLMTLVLVPLWTSALARSFSWVVLLQPQGLVDRVFGVVLKGTPVAVTLAMAQVLLPFVVLPMYAVMQGIDRSLLAAGASLGAGRWTTFRRIYFPLSLPGVTTGVSLVFILSLGFYLTPALLGSTQDAVIAQLLIIRTQQLDFGGAGALGMFLLVLTLAVLWLSNRLARGSGSRAVAANTVGAAVAVSTARRRPGLPLTAVVGLIAVVLTGPTLLLVPMSLSSAPTFAFPPPGWSGRWYRNLFESPVWVESMAVTLKVCLVATPLAILIGTAAAFGLMRMGPRVRGALHAGILAPLIVPHTLVALAFYGTFLKLQLNGTLRGLIFADIVISLPFVVIAVLARLQRHDSRLRDAGLSLGAAPRTVFFRVTLPLVLPGILAGALLAFVTVFDEFVIALLLQSPTLRTLSVQMYDSVAYEIDPTISAASTLLVVIVSVVIFSGQLFGTRKKKGVVK